MSITIQGEIVKRYLDALMVETSGRIHLFKKTIARKIYAENPQAFKDSEEVRSLVRYYTGSMGAEAREQLTDTKYVQNENNPYELPDEEVDFDPAPFVLDKSCTSIAIIGDVHIPYHSIEAVNAAIAWIKEHHCNTIILNGDIIDHYQLSYFERDPRRRSIKEEIENVYQFFDALRNEFPDYRIYYKKANHEYRWDKFMKLKAYELFGIPEFDFNNILKFKFFNIEPIEYKRRIKVSHCYILHGDEYRGFGADLVNPARWLYLRTKTNAICGHFHRTSEHSEPNLNDELVAAWSVGCLCNLNPFWNPYNKWNHGLARLRVKEDGNFDVTNLKIFNGELL
jgi:predicted phosphodiesterase